MERVLLDPTAETMTTIRRPAARLTTIAGTRIGLLDISKPRGNVYLDALEPLLTARGAEVVRYRKPTHAKPAPADLRAEIATNCGAVIEALAD